MIGSGASVVQADSGRGPAGLATGAVFKAKFDKAGDFAYVCNFHPNVMKGTVHVNQ